MPFRAARVGRSRLNSRSKYSKWVQLRMSARHRAISQTITVPQVVSRMWPKATVPV